MTMMPKLKKARIGFILLIALAMIVNPVLAQNQVSGTVTDSQSGEPLVGVTVLIKGTTDGTITDVDGRYSLNAPDDAVLVLSFVGLASQEVSVGGRSIVDIAMDADFSELEEVVITGYTSSNKADVTSSIASVDIENMQKRHTPDVTQALQGNVTGVQIFATDNNPGAAFNFNIRGISSPEGASGSPPLVIVDGVQISGLQLVDFENVVGFGDGVRQTTGLENINPNDIESIEILKDASAAAIYGSRAANGVILVTTKRGKSGAPQLTYNTSIGTQVPFQGPNTANAKQYIEIMQGMYGDDLALADDAGLNPPQAALDYIETGGQGFSSYDWYNKVYNAASTQNHDLSVAGGGDYGSYRVSVGYRDQDGIALGTGFKRGTIRANSDFNVSEKLTIGSSLALARSETDPEPYAFSRSVYYKAIAQVPYFSPFGVNPDPDAPLAERVAAVANDPSLPERTRSFYWGGGDNPEALIRNPFDYARFWSRDQRSNNIAANLYLQYEIIEGLTAKVSGSYNQTEAFIKTRNRTQSQPQEYFNGERTIDQEQITESNWIMDNILSYNKRFNKHNVNALVGYVVQEFNDQTFSGGKADFLSDITSTLDGPGANPLFTYVNGSIGKSRLVSFVSQANYSYDDRYMVTFNFRRDASSRFNERVREGNFPGISAGWRVSNEGFWNSLGLGNIINDFKIRAGYGILGRQNVGTFPPAATLSFEPYSFGGTLVNGLMTPGPVNLLITWEESVTSNIGFEFGILDDQLSGSVEYFERDTEDLVSSIVIPGSAGGGEIPTNDGLIENRGVEIALQYSQTIGQVNFNIGVNATYVDTKLTSIPEDVIDGEAPEWDVPPVIRIFEGRQPSEFWLIKTDGIFRTQADLDSHVGPSGELIQPDAQLGDIRFVDADGDGLITSEDRQFAGTGRPPWTGGMNINAGYKSFDFSVNLYGNFGHHVYNGPRYLLEQPFGFDNFSADLTDAWTPERPNASLPRNNPFDLDENYNSRSDSDRYLEKGDFIKASLIEVGYTLPNQLIQVIGLSSARISLSTQNLFTITGYSGIDPEQGRDGWVSAGIDRGTTPQFRSFLFNLSASF